MVRDAFFIVGALAIVFLDLLPDRLDFAREQRDEQLINAKLGEYAAAYQRGGIDELADTVRAEQQHGARAPVRPGRRSRISKRSSSARRTAGRSCDALETASLPPPRRPTLVQVGKSTEQRDDILARFRAALGIVTLTIVIVALTGGFLR